MRWDGLDSEQALSWLGAACATLVSDRVVWYPKYGSAVVCVEGSYGAGAILQPGQCAVYVIGLDEWKFEVHRCDLPPEATVESRRCQV